MYASYTLHALEFCTYLPLTSWDILERSECVHHKTADEFAKANRTGTVQLYVSVRTIMCGQRAMRECDTDCPRVHIAHVSCFQSRLRSLYYLCSNTITIVVIASTLDL